MYVPLLDPFFKMKCLLNRMSKLLTICTVVFIFLISLKLVSKLVGFNKLFLVQVVLQTVVYLYSLMYCTIPYD